MTFDQQRILITGATGGIGRCIAGKLARRGARLVLTDQSKETLDALCQRLNHDLDHELNTGAVSRRQSDREASVQHPSNPRVLGISGDLTNPEFCDALPQRSSELLGGESLDCVINNAGIIRRGDVLDTSDADWAVTMAVNVEAVFRICRASIRLMTTSGTGGTIVNVASCWGLYPGPGHLAYCTSKAAVAAMTRCLGRDHAHAGIRVNAVAPNEVDTPMLRSGFRARGLTADTAIADLNASVPLGRIAVPDDIADVMLFLASDQSRYLCGECIEVNGAKPVY